MCSAEQLEMAASLMKGSDARKVSDVAKNMKRGKATPAEIKNAEGLARGVMARAKAQMQGQMRAASRSV